MAHEITVRDALRLPTLRGTTVVAGHRGLDRTVRHVGVAAGSEIARWVKPAAALLSTGYLLREHLAELPDLVSELDARSVACLAVRLGTWLPDFPPALLRAADNADLPLIRLTDGFAFDDILIDVLSRLNTALAADLELAEHVHTTLADILLRGGTVSRIPPEISRLIGAQVALLAPDGEPIVVAGDGPQPALDWRELEEAASQSHSDGDRLVRRVGIPGHTLGYLMCTRSEPPFSGAEVRALERASVVAALALTQQTAVRDVEIQHQAELLGRVLRGDPSHPDAIVALFRDVGWRVPGRCRVARISVWCATNPARATTWLRSTGLPLLRSALGESNRTAMAVVDGSLVAVVPVEHVERLRTALHRVLVGFDRRAAEESDAIITAGIGRDCPDLGGLVRGHHQARVAASAARRRPPGRRVCDFTELGALGPVLAAAEGEGLLELQDSPLAPLEHLHPRDRQELLATLRALLHDNMSVAEASRSLHCHYNTIRQRVRRLEGLLGPFTADGDVRLGVTIALRLLDLGR